MLVLSVLIGLAGLVGAQEDCPGYRASNVQQTDHGLTADLQLAGAACNIFGLDLPNLTLTVEYQTGSSGINRRSRNTFPNSSISFETPCYHPGHE